MQLFSIACTKATGDIVVKKRQSTASVDWNFDIQTAKESKDSE